MKGRITKTGYRRNSPDVNNDFNIIPSNRISMQGVDFPVFGVDNMGNSQMMYPGGEYEFQGDYVTELPAYGSGGLTQWFAEKWVDIKTGKTCGRSGKDKKGRPYPACRPSKRVNSTTPKTTSELSAAEKAKFKKKKTSGKRIDYNHKRAQEGIEVPLNRSEVFNIPRTVRYENGKMVVQDKPIWDGFLDEVTVTPYTQSNIALEYMMNNKAAGGLDPIYPVFDALTLGLRTPVTAGAKALQTGVKKAPSVINPRYFKPNANMYYRGIGKEGMEDALQSGVFRAKPHDMIPARNVDLGSLGSVDMAKRFNKTYYSPQFSIADRYGAGYIAEVPKNAATFSKRYKGSDWSMMTKDQIPVSQGQLLQKNWWSGYKPIKQEGGELEKYQIQGEVPWATFLNPMNWGVPDYTDKGDFGTAFKSASQSGEKEFMWNNKRYTTERKNENPYKTSSFESSFIPTTYLTNKLNVTADDNVVRDKRSIDISNGKLYFSRTNEATDGKIILGGDYVEDEPTAYPAYAFKNYITERYGARGEKVEIDNNTQMYYGIVDNKFKTGLINDFRDDDIIVPIRYGGKYDKKEKLSQEESDFIDTMTSLKEINKTPVDPESKEFKYYIDNVYEKPWLDSFSAQRVRYRKYRENEAFKKTGLSGTLKENYDRLNQLLNDNATFTKDGKSIYNSGVNGKLILHSPSQGKQLFLYKNSASEIKNKSQEFLKKYPDAEFISMDTGRYNFLVENPKGLSPEDFKTYQAADISRGDKIGYNIVYDDMIYESPDDQDKKARGGQLTKAQEGIEVPKRDGVRKNPDGSVSTHLMATETLDGKNWFSFPTLFQNPDGTWIDMSDRPWKEAYEEAKRRGEVIDFGADKQAAIKFGEGSWKKQTGGQQGPPNISEGPLSVLEPVKEMGPPAPLDPLTKRLESIDTEVKSEPASGFYNSSILEGLSSINKSRRLDLLNAADRIAKAQGDNESLRRLLILTAAMENSLGVDPNAYGRTYTSGSMSLDPDALTDLFSIREGATDYTTQQKKNFKWIQSLGYTDNEAFKKALKADDPVASVAAARLYYGTKPDPLPPADDPRALYDYYVKNYNQGGLEKYQNNESRYKSFEQFYNSIYKKDGGESLPDYSRYDNLERAWFAARKDLGKGKIFMYGGQKHSTYTPKGL